MKVPVRISTRDAALLKALRSGLTDEEVATTLGVSLGTFQAELSSLARRLQRVERAAE